MISPVNVRKLIAQGYVQVSRRHRTLARLPAGLTGRQALDAAAPGRYPPQMPEESCADQYRRVYAGGNDVLKLSRDDFADYLRVLRALAEETS